MKIRTAVIAVAGYGTRFLPATKVTPKELLPIVDKPIVQYLVEEAVASGIEDVILVIRSGSGAIADHFDSSRELEAHLARQGSLKYLEIIRAIPRLANFACVRQAAHLPYGNGTPILAAKSFLNRNEPFVFMFGDDLVKSDVPCVQQLIQLYQQHAPGAVIAFQEVPRAEVNRYGIAQCKPGTAPREMVRIVEKPKVEDAPSHLAQIGRFVLAPQVIEILESLAGNVQPGQELYLTYAIDQLIQRGSKVLAHPIEGTWYTTGDPLRYLKTSVEYAFDHPEIGAEFKQYVKELAAKLP